MTRPAEAFARAQAMAAAEGHSVPDAEMPCAGDRSALEGPSLEIAGHGAAEPQAAPDGPRSGPAPRRIQRRRAKGWKLPPDAVCITRPGPWGNPFVVGRDGTAAECVHHYAAMLAGSLCVSPHVEFDELRAARAYVLAHVYELRGRDLACWCREGAVCHGTVLLALANRPLVCEAAP